MNSRCGFIIDREVELPRVWLGDDRQNVLLNLLQFTDSILVAELVEIQLDHLFRRHLGYNFSWLSREINQPLVHIEQWFHWLPVLPRTKIIVDQFDVFRLVTERLA